MIEPPSETGRTPRRQLMLLGALFAGVVGVLAIGYFLFLRADYVVLAQGMRAGDAAAVVAELDKRGTAYRLSDGGTTILVPERDADATRIAIAGSDAAARGQIGFELFNKSDMGLTNFAQKINYQRALQGELVRTIMMMDGVESARVHLALPERTLFRADQTEPSAAVTVAMKPGQTADPSRVSGIQRLVSAAVPSLPDSRVVVLDSSGRVLSRQPAESAGPEQPVDVEERSAVEAYYHARARGAVERAIPGMRFALHVLTIPLAAEAADAAGNGTAEAPEADWVPSGGGADRNFRLRILFVTEAALGTEDQAVVRGAVAQAVALSDTLGDTLSFETGPIAPAVSTGTEPAPRAAQSARQPAPGGRFEPPAIDWASAIGWAVAAIAAAAAGAFLLHRARRARFGGDVHDAFAERLRRELNLEECVDGAI